MAESFEKISKKFHNYCDSDKNIKKNNNDDEKNKEKNFSSLSTLPFPLYNEDSLDENSSNFDNQNFGNLIHEKIYSIEKRNARERTRVHTVNQAFLVLKHHIPSLRIFTKRVSKLKILRAAILYIDTLSNLLKDQRLTINSTTMEIGRGNNNLSNTTIISPETSTFNMLSFQTHFSPALVAAHTFPYFDYDSFYGRVNYQTNSNNDLLNSSVKNPYSLESLYNQQSFMSNAFYNIEI
ncbi:Myc-type, basic helix-loop-helix (bHLH) domain-containing protein [Strongyloides ratti]|uniref:Myc-type, basic helix-loop-helix (BHLH) domain-containing protein n=1 Tax=Strongyloides ratti TaxID=34506 RepID=A0A090LFW9_STRRB|nr:Myc-type, basic helix-loop-helix (bHLH) domain-containing protein [Strongyloides ratti]CEF67043.1 Myc-type, basic helix-loop-helix (bHLH) domain-containing protein [Strongyloides ratti]